MNWLEKQYFDILGDELDQNDISGSVQRVITLIKNCQKNGSEYTERVLKNEKPKTAALVRKQIKSGKQAGLWGGILGAIGGAIIGLIVAIMVVNMIVA